MRAFRAFGANEFLEKLDLKRLHFRLSYFAVPSKMLKFFGFISLAKVLLTLYYFIHFVDG